ncbi:MAG: ribosome small subunit-dependent GTPase A [Coriobacteriia bacterium]|nr:ribosome small subunit-dependent GTPase A [Coriobacteriia bacterium]
MPSSHSEPSLEFLGFSDRWRALFAPYTEQGLVPARVIRADRGSVLAATGDGVIRAESTRRLVKEAFSAEGLPAAGDWVAVRLDTDLELPQIEAVLPRTSAFTRADPGKDAAIQVLAANIDTVFIIHPIVEEPNVRRLERELALAWESGAVPVVVLAKADLSTDPAAALEVVRGIALDVDIHMTSAKTGEGVDALLAYADGHRTVALIGPSGAGKSTLINLLVGSDVQATREVRLSDGRGRHTTVARELVPLPNGGVLVDTPGLRAVALTDAEAGIAAAFPEIDALSVECRFRDCMHESEPGCAVLAAVEAGTLAEDRLESYRKLLKEARFAAARTDARLKAEEEQRWIVIHKSARKLYKDRGHK